uniref:Variable lymphocyte receptor A cassette n=1 Tax=Petromyzon marinus TaxID=7757 RepID=S4S113_PETMA
MRSRDRDEAMREDRRLQIDSNVIERL